MGSAWVVDSNYFIHLGQKGEDEVLADLTSARAWKMLITPGVEDEVATVRMRRMEGRPRLLDVLAPVLKSVPVDEADVRALAAKIGERRTSGRRPLAHGARSFARRSGRAVVLGRLQDGHDRRNGGLGRRYSAVHLHRAAGRERRGRRS